MAKEGFHADDGLFNQLTFSIDKVRSFTIINLRTRYNSYSVKTKKVRFLESWPHYQAIVFYAKKMVIL